MTQSMIQQPIIPNEMGPICADEAPIDARYWLLVPATLRKRGQALLHRQCWCWGQDVRREAGNALLHLGFERVRPPQDVKGATQYSCGAEESCAVALWGFGVCYRRRCKGTVFLARDIFAPRFSRRDELPSGVWEAQQLEGFGVPPSLTECRIAIDLLCETLEWIGAYEEQILDEFGLDYRVQTLKKWSHRAVDPSVSPTTWRDLSVQCRQKIRVMARDDQGVREVGWQAEGRII